MAKVTFKIEGLSELQEALQELPKATGKNVLRRALIKAGTPMAEQARASARTLTKTLQRSFGVSERLASQQRKNHKKESQVEVFAGAGNLAQAIMEEFGTVHSAANPMLRPAWDAHKRSALDSIAKDLADEIEKARARLARKAEREAAKMK